MVNYVECIENGCYPPVLSEIINVVPTAASNSLATPHGEEVINTRADQSSTVVTIALYAVAVLVTVIALATFWYIIRRRVKYQ